MKCYWDPQHKVHGVAGCTYCRMQVTPCNSMYSKFGWDCIDVYIFDKVFKNGPSKNCARQSL